MKSSTVALSGLESVLGSGADAAVPREELERIIEEPPARATPIAESISLDGDKMLALWEARGASASSVEGLSSVIMSVLKDLAKGFLLLVVVRYEEGQRQLVKFAYDAQMKRPTLRELQRWGWSECYRWAMRVLSSFGLLARLEEFRHVSAGWSQSYHAEIVPAGGTYAARTTLAVRTPDSPRPLESVDDSPSRPHVRAPQEGRRRSRGDSGVLTTLLQARRDGLVFPLFLGAAIITGVLAFVAQRVEDLDGVTLGALLLAPFALSLYYARSDENSYVTNAMRGVRVIGTIPVVAGVVVIALVALGYLGPAPPRSQEWAITTTEWAAKASSWATVLLFMALIAPILGWLARHIEARLPGPDLVKSVAVALGLIAWLAADAGLIYGLARVLPIC
jgi:hypothetical protein